MVAAEVKFEITFENDRGEDLFAGRDFRSAHGASFSAHATDCEEKGERKRSKVWARNGHHRSVKSAVSGQSRGRFRGSSAQCHSTKKDV